MKEHPMLFSGAMVRAILEGRKTQTRRVIQSRSRAHPEFVLVEQDGGWLPYLSDDGESNNCDGMEYPMDCHYGQPGDRIWVRETWSSDDGRTAHYRADGETHNAGLPWKPSIHMPRWACRLTLEVIGVRVERLNSISREDAAAEGACYLAEIDYDGTMPDGTKVIQKHYWPEQNFARLWDSINGAGSWAANPWVWALEFKRVLA